VCVCRLTFLTLPHFCFSLTSRRWDLIRYDYTIPLEKLSDEQTKPALLALSRFAKTKHTIEPYRNDIKISKIVSGNHDRNKKQVPQLRSRARSVLRQLYEIYKDDLAPGGLPVIDSFGVEYSDRDYTADLRLVMDIMRVADACMTDDKREKHCSYRHPYGMTKLSHTKPAPPCFWCEDYGRKHQPFERKGKLSYGGQRTTDDHLKWRQPQETSTASVSISSKLTTSIVAFSLCLVAVFFAYQRRRAQRSSRRSGGRGAGVAYATLS